MPQMINRGKELIRISPKDPRAIEYSPDGGRVWVRRYRSLSSQGNFEDLTDNGKEILATCEKGLFYSKNEGKIWIKRNSR